MNSPDPTMIQWLESIQHEIRDTRNHLDRKIDELKKDQDARLRKLEADRGKIIGAVSVISAIASLIWTGLLSWFRGSS